MKTLKTCVTAIISAMLVLSPVAYADKWGDQLNPPVPNLKKNTVDDGLNGDRVGETLIGKQKSIIFLGFLFKIFTIFHRNEPLKSFISDPLGPQKCFYFP